MKKYIGFLIALISFFVGAMENRPTKRQKTYVERPMAKQYVPSLASAALSKLPTQKKNVASIKVSYLDVHAYEQSSTPPQKLATVYLLKNEQAQVIPVGNNADLMRIIYAIADAKTPKEEQENKRKIFDTALDIIINMHTPQPHFSNFLRGCLAKEFSLDGHLLLFNGNLSSTDNQLFAVLLDNGFAPSSVSLAQLYKSFFWGGSGNINKFLQDFSNLLTMILSNKLPKVQKEELLFLWCSLVHSMQEIFYDEKLIHTNYLQKNSIHYNLRKIMDHAEEPERRASFDALYTILWLNNRFYSFRYSDGWNIMHIAVARGDHYIVEKLLQLPDAKSLIEETRERVSPFDVAIQKGDLDLVKLLLAYNGDIVHANCLLNAISAGSKEVVDYFLKEKIGLVNPPEGQLVLTPLILAATTERSDILQLLLNHGHRFTQNGIVPCENNISIVERPLFGALFYARRDCVKVLLKAGAPLTTTCQELMEANQKTMAMVQEIQAELAQEQQHNT